MDRPKLVWFQGFFYGMNEIIQSTKVGFATTQPTQPTQPTQQQGALKNNHHRKLTTIKRERSQTKHLDDNQ